VDSLAGVEDELPTTPEGAEEPVAVDGIPSLPPELSTKEQELRRLVDAGAASPEELRALAAKLEEKRIYEESLWQREVRPALMQAKKRRRFSLGDLRRDSVDKGSSGLVLGGLLFAAVLLLLLIATQTSFLWLFVAVVGVLVYAWVQGSRSSDPGQPAEVPPDVSD
jgi:hypothetical protein